MDENVEMTIDEILDAIERGASLLEGTDIIATVRPIFTAEEFKALGNAVAELKAYRATGFTPEQLVEQKESKGWISADILPENDDDVLVWFEYYRYGSYNGLYRTIGVGNTFRGEWSHFVDGVSGWRDLRIIAWMPLPKPPGWRDKR